MTLKESGVRVAGAVQQGRKISAYGLAHDEHGRLLLVRGSGQSYFPGAWNLPGGGVEHGESPTDALMREFVEETRLTVEVQSLVDVRSDLALAPAGDRLTHFDRIVYDVRVTGGELRGEADGSTDAARWFAKDELAEVSLLPWLARFLDYPVSVEPAAVGSAAIAAAFAASRALPRDPADARFQRFSAYGVVRDPDGRILLTRIAAGYPGAGHWHLPGGGTDFGETARDGLLREIREETGQDAVIGDLLTVVDMHNPRAYGPEQRSLDWHTVRAIFDVRVPEPTDPFVDLLGGSTDRVAWFTPADARQLKLNRLAQMVLADHVR
jgi:ADP-ribose pyrophosphatase YjhB (NUDIX family)